MLMNAVATAMPTLSGRGCGPSNTLSSPFRADAGADFRRCDAVASCVVGTQVPRFAKATNTSAGFHRSTHSEQSIFRPVRDANRSPTPCGQAISPLGGARAGSSRGRWPTHRCSNPTTPPMPTQPRVYATGGWSRSLGWASAKEAVTDRSDSHPRRTQVTAPAPHYWPPRPSTRTPHRRWPREWSPPPTPRARTVCQRV